MIENLSKEQIEGILDAVPVELLFIDEHEKIRYWNKGEKRSRKASADDIGKEIRSCHKPESLPMLEAFIKNLKSGKKDEQEFWVSYSDRLLNRFIAVRGADGKYLGLIQYLLDYKALEKLAEEKKGAYKIFP